MKLSELIKFEIANCDLTSPSKIKKYLQNKISVDVSLKEIRLIIEELNGFKKIEYKGFSIDIEIAEERRAGFSNKSISYAIFKDDEEVKSDSTYDFESVLDFVDAVKKYIDSGMKNSLCSTPYSVLLEKEIHNALFEEC